ncbi:MAG: hypothetical protein U0175_33925 [Caldilineaceae bacterium]
MDELQRQRAIELISASPSKESLLRLISWLDTECFGSPLVSLPRQILARAVIAIGYRLIDKLGLPTIKATTEAAEFFALEPTPESFDVYLRAATNSYPFGAGDGCYAIHEIGFAGCEPGSGCSSGSGCLYSSGLENDFVMQCIAGELIPWLENREDPVAQRWVAHG